MFTTKIIERKPISKTENVRLGFNGFTRRNATTISVRLKRSERKKKSNERI